MWTTFELERDLMGGISFETVGDVRGFFDDTEDNFGEDRGIFGVLDLN